MASLFNTKISNTYVGLLKMSDNLILSSTLREISDGSGNGAGVFLNTSGDLKASGILEFGSLKDTGENITITKFVDEADGIANNDNDTSIPTSGAIIDYVASKITLEDLDFSGDSGNGSVDLDSQTFAIVGTANEIETSAGSQQLQIGLPSSITVNLVGNVTGNVTGDVTGNLTGNVTSTGTSTFTTVDINGGNIDNTIIGATTAVAGSFTTINASSTITGNVTGNLTGNVTGNVTGDLTGDVTGNVTGNITGVGTLSDGSTAVTQSINDNSTKIATTAYVDSSVDSVDTLSEILAIGNTTGGTDIAVSANDDITFTDTSKAIFGDGSDLQIYHNGSQDRIESSSSFLIVESSNFIVRNNGGSEDYAKFLGNGGVELYYDNSKKFETTSTGVSVTGSLTTSGAATIGGVATVDGLDLGDNEKIRLGASQDLEIYHDGSNSYIEEKGTGDLIIKSFANLFLKANFGGANDETFISNTGNGGVGLYYNGVQKAETVSNGFNVTGGITTTEEIKIVDGSATGSPKLSFHQTTNERAYIQYADTGEKLIIDSDADLVLNTNNTARLTIDSTGASSFGGNVSIGSNLTIAGDLTVNGTTTTVNTETLAVEDPLISMAKDNSANSVDIGFYGRYNDGSNRYLGLYSDASDSNIFNLFKGTTTEPTTTVDTSATDYDTATLRVQNLIGASSGNDRIKVQGSNGTLQWGSSANFGQLSWDTGYALIRGMSSKGLKLQVNSSTTALELDTSKNATFTGDVTASHSGNTLLTVQSTDDNAILKIDSNSGGTGTGANQDPYLQFGSGGTIKANIHYDNTATDLIFQTNNNVTALTLDNSQNATFAGKLRVGTTLGVTQLEVNGDIGIGRVAGAYTFRETVGGNLRAAMRSNALNELIFEVGASTEALKLDSSTNATFAGNVSIPVAKQLFFGGGSHTYISEDVDDRLRIFCGGDEHIRLTAGGNGDRTDFFRPTFFTNNANFAGNVSLEQDASSPVLLVKAVGQTSSTTPTASLILSPGSFSSNATAPRIIGYRTADFSSAAARSAGLSFGVAQNNTAKEVLKIAESGNLFFNGHTSNTTVLSMNTADGSDTKQISIAGGGADSDGRGARMRLYGNEHASNAGVVDLSTGNIAGADMTLSATDTLSMFAGGAKRLLLNSNGKVTVGASNTNSASAATNFDFEVQDGMAFGGSAFTYATIQGDDAGLGNIELRANAYPANTGTESSIKMFTSTSSGGTFQAMTIRGGKTGIQHNTPVTFLDVRGNNTGQPATSGTTVSDGTRLRLASTTSSSLSASLDFGLGTSSRAWIQSTSINDLSDGNTLLLNPNGGSIGIGRLTPAKLIDANLPNSGQEGASIVLRNTSGGSGAFNRIYFAPTASDPNTRSAIIQGENVDGNNNMALVFKTSAGSDPEEHFRINADGSIRIQANDGIPTMITGVANGGDELRLRQSRGTIASPSNSSANGDGNYITSYTYASAAYTKIGQIGIITGSATNNGDITFGTATSGSVTEKLRIESDGAIRAKTGSFVVDTAGQGIYLGGTASANLLDDYEEGTWTPQVYYQNSTDQGNSTNTTQTGVYTKIGNKVTIQFRLIWEITGTPATDNIGIKNLPFNGQAIGNNSTYAENPCVLKGYTNPSTGGRGSLTMTIPNNNQSIALFNDSNLVGNMGAAIGAGTHEIRFNLTYFTDQ